MSATRLSRNIVCPRLVKRCSNVGQWDMHGRKFVDWTGFQPDMKAFTERSLLYREVLAQRSFYAEKSLHKRDLHTEAFTHRHVYTRKVLQIDALSAHRNFYTEQLQLVHRSFYTKRPLHREVFAHRSFYTRKLLYRKAFTHRNFHTQKLCTPRSLTQRSFCAQTRLHREAFTQRSFCTQKLFTHRTFCTK